MDGMYCEEFKRKEQECEELIKQRDKFEFGNNILEHERNNYKQALDEIEGYCEKILSDLLHYSQGTINTAEKIRNIINNAKEQ